MLGMRNDGQTPHGAVPRSGRTNGIIPTSFRALSSYLRIVSSGASTVASTVKSAASAASAVVDRNNDASQDQVLWAGFDNLECEGNIARLVLLLGYRYGFQVWDVQESDNVRCLVSRHDGSVSFLQMLPKPIASKRSGDKFAGSRPLVVICADDSFPKGSSFQDGLAITSNGSTQSFHDRLSGDSVPSVVWFYSLRCQSYVRQLKLKFRSVVYSIRCSSRVVAVLQAAQIHCFDAATLEREYTILTNPIDMSCSGFGGIGFGPLAVGARWMAYSGSPLAVSNSGRVSSQHLTPVSFSCPASNGSRVAHYAKESGKQLAAGIVTLGDMGYKKLSRYYSDLLPDGNNSLQAGNVGLKVQGITNGHFPDADNVGMVIVRDIVSKFLVAQFRAHKSPISALCFDPSGTLLVTASVQGHNVKVYRIMPGSPGTSSGSDAGASYSHLYTLQRGFTNAVIQDISFSSDSHWIMISSSRGTCHLFAISPLGGSLNFQFADACFTAESSGPGVMQKPAVGWSQNSGNQMPNQQSFCASGPPITLAAVSRIRSGNNGWRSTVSGAAASATGRFSSLPVAVASVFHNCEGNDLYPNTGSLSANYNLLVFSPGCVIQYALRICSGLDSITAVSGLSDAYGSAANCDARLVVEAIQKWNICQRQNRREREDNIDIYGENGTSDSCKIFPEGMEENSFYPEAKGTVTKVKISAEERHHKYISEAELQMHRARIPLWAKRQICFQSMMIDDIKMDVEDCLRGEIEIESIPTCMIEARSKDLVPVFDHLQTSKFRHARTPSDTNSNGRLLHQRSGLSENGRLTSRSSSGSLDSMTNGGIAVAELNSGIEGTRWDGLQMPSETSKGFVNNNGSPKSSTRLGIVNKREKSLMGENQFKFVNNNIKVLKMENRIEDEGDEFD